MCIYSAIYKNKEISFSRESLFQEKGQIIVNHPINSDDVTDKQIPKKIRLAELAMKQVQKNEIMEIFSREREKRIKAKTRKIRAAMRQI